MTVSDLIKELQKLNPNTEIWANSSIAGECFELNSAPFYYGTIAKFQATPDYWAVKQPGDQDANGQLNIKEVLLYDAE